MKSNLNEFISLQSNNPGIYKMIDEKGAILYIGKSKNLRTRIQYYFRTNIESERIKRMVHSIDKIETVETDTHFDAKILELREIKSIKPIYNRQFNRRVRLTSLEVDKNILSYKWDGSFGPFRKNKIIYNLVDYLKRIYPIKIANNKIIFEYKLFEKKILGQDLKDSQEALRKILSEKIYMDLFIQALDEKMVEASKNLHFELAIFYRDLIKSMSYISYRLFEFNDLWKSKIIYKEEGLRGSFLYLIHQGQILKKTSSKKDISDDDLKFESKVQRLEEENFEEVNLIYSHITKADEGEIVYESFN